MIPLYTQKNYNICIWGLKITGISAYKSLISVGARVKCYDDNEKVRNDFIEKFGSINILDISNTSWKDIDYIILSPGIDLKKSSYINNIINKYNIKILTDIDLIYLEKNNLKNQFIGITGTNGKSTCATLTNYLLSVLGYKSSLCGNIGIASLEANPDSDIYLLELSSFQLELINNLRLNIGVILNIEQDHLDRHGSFENYAKCKIKISSLSQNLIICIDSLKCMELYLKLKSQKNINIIPISTTKKIDNGIYIKDKIYDNYFSNNAIYQIPSNIYLKGLHNNQNLGAAYAILKLMKQDSNKVLSAIEGYKGLEHRMEFVRKYENISFYNDSKATNLSSTRNAISSLDNIFLLFGGDAKGQEFKDINKYLNNVIEIFVFGSCKFKIIKELEFKNINIATSLDDAFQNALSKAKIYNKSCNILLSPACSSTDEFTNYIERGNMFKNLCNNI